MNNYTRTPRASRRSKKAGLRRTLLVVCMMLVVMVGSIAGTVAWLTAQTEAVTNTFTVGDIKIKLEETTTSYKVVPGATDEKDPKVTVESGSEKCYVYVTVENNLVIEGKTVATLDIDAGKWNVVATSGNKTLYRYYTVVDATSAEQVLPVFTKVTYDGEAITKENINNLKDKTIVVDSFAHQSENIANVKVADEAAKGHFSMTSSN